MAIQRGFRDIQVSLLSLRAVSIPLGSLLAHFCKLGEVSMQAARKPIVAVVVLFLAAWVVDAPTAVGQTTITVTANATDFSPSPVAAGSDSTSNLSATSSLPTPPSEATITGREWTWTLLLNGVSTYTPAQLALDQPSNASATATLTANLVMSGINQGAGPFAPALPTGVGAPQPVIAPTGGFIVQTPLSDIYHKQWRPTTGFCGDAYVTATNKVSFKGIQVREGACGTAASGFYAIWNLAPHDAEGWASLLPPVATGYQWDLTPWRGYDKIDSGDPGGRWNDGELVWEIPWQYKQSGTDETTDPTVVHPITPITYQSNAFKSGTCSIQKGGAGPIATNAKDASSTPPGW